MDRPIVGVKGTIEIDIRVGHPQLIKSYRS